MNKIKVKILQYGDLAESVDYEYIKNFKSSLFEIVGVEKKNLWNTKNDYDYCTYPDNEWKKHIKKKESNIGLVLVLTNALLEDGFYARRLSDCLVVFSFARIFSFLKEAHIGLENVIIKTLYEYSLIYENLYNSSIWHHATNGCLYDMDGNLADIALTCREPHICDVCKGELLKSGVSEEKIYLVEKEIKKLKISWIYRLLEWVERHPLWSLGISAFFAIICGIISDILYDIIKNNLLHF